ncbi:hypothetical protein SFUMM280S_01511 [Streptomyces fumanus]
MAIIETEAALHEAHRDNHTHRDVNGGWLRPAVFGAMDGLVSNLALMTGVAGGAVSQQTVVLSGLAGLAAGASPWPPASTPPSPPSASWSRPNWTSSAASCAGTRRTRRPSWPPSTRRAASSPAWPARWPASCPGTRSGRWRYTPARNWASTPPTCPRRSSRPSPRVGSFALGAALAAEKPYADWLQAGEIELSDLPEREHIVHTHASVTRRQQTFGYTEEELRVILAPMAKAGAEPIGSMGTDSPIAALSERPRLLFDYFTQLFAQVTNPPLDAIREELVTSLRSSLGPQGNLLEPTAASCRTVVLPFPVIDNDELAKLIHINADGDMPGFKAATLSGLYRVHGGGEALAARIEEICAEADAAIDNGARLIVLSDRHSDAEHAPIPSLLLTAAVHHHLIRTKQRTQVGLLVEAGDVREVHHVALLIGYGAAAVNPYLAMESVEDLVRAGTFLPGIEPEKAIKNLIYALGKGVLKVMSKMGISTVASYRGAQVFEAVGLDEHFVAKYFNGTATKIGGVGIDVIAQEVAARHAKAYPASGIAPAHRALEIGGEYQWRREGEPHLFDPETVFRLQHSTRSGKYEIFKKYTERVNEQSERLMTLRGLFGFKSDRQPIPLDEVEPVSEIVKRFSTGAMSYGSISQEAHETLAIAMNQLGGKSNTGEGGEDPERLYDPARRSSIKQVASGRFGVTSEYLVNARHPDQDGPGRQARRGRPVARPQGLPVGRQDPALHAGRRPDLAAAAPRHLLHRGPSPAHPRPEERQPPGAHPRQAGLRGRRRHRRRGRLQGPRGRRAHLRSRRRHRRLPAHLAQARGRPLGAGPGRDPADPAAQRPARPDRRTDRRPAQDRPRRGHPRPAPRRFASATARSSSPAAS